MWFWYYFIYIPYNIFNNEIVFLVNILGIKEFQVLSDSFFQIFSIIRMVCMSCSIIFIFLSLLYSILLITVLVQYMDFIGTMIVVQEELL